jgi:A/G-specific adenine glycosylase
MKKLIKTSNFSKKLLIWHKNDNTRTMPWKGELDPYKIWLSEIILQQTRVEQGMDYYNKFIINYPTVKHLAKAEENDVFKMWEGLGYYSRCKNLIATARFIAFELGGEFPSTYDSILALKGVGPYTAAAISSFAYNLPIAVVDGNVLRVLSRFFDIATPIDSTEGKKHFTELAQSLIDKASPSLYNQAIMDFGATICKPMLPLCSQCVINKNCLSLSNKTVKQLPVKKNKIKKTNRFFYYVVASHENAVYVRKRVEKDIWQNLWEFILFEESEKMEVDDIVASAAFIAMFGRKPNIKMVSVIQKQQLTHQSIASIFIHIDLKKSLKVDSHELLLKKNIGKIPFPRLITSYFENTILN